MECWNIGTKGGKSQIHDTQNRHLEKTLSA